MSKIKNVVDVSGWRLCLGCGACSYVCPEEAIELVDIEDQGIRPITDLAKCQSCSECLKICPGVQISHQPFDRQTIQQLRESWGPVLEVWEGYSTDPEIRYKGSSGGVTTALALFCLENEDMAGVLHIGTNPEAPLQNVPIFSKSREELLACIGSRYSPAAVCEKLNWIHEADSPCVVIGKPCDIVALRKSQAISQELDEKVGLAISIFCAGTPSTVGTYKVLESFGIKPEEVEKFRYRGCGWPGMTEVKVKGNGGRNLEMSYEDSWGGILSKYVQLRCRLCPDSTGEFADISCGDPWYRPVEADNPGQSLVLARTEKGREILREAMRTGYLELRRGDSYIVAASQPSLLNKRQQLWGRLGAMWLMGIPTPNYRGFYMFANWRRLSLRKKVLSVVGTLVRIVQRKWNKPITSVTKIPGRDKSPGSTANIIHTKQGRD